ncbi:uncharacterized protein LOC108909969 isoform X2 [Anoplophora glabripennis]|uniref:uncharacterized protein LOC108909969 isoform X2 n=1 Tax=Anoplophora glabripennis TaxID=217634 RepID=UPI0008745499|nr:uncharacterized protein LOC108909969 isoform X2 [Anoplophora glabripennis]
MALVEKCFCCSVQIASGFFATYLLKNSLCLISWMFSITILTFPEAGMVIYMSIQYWRIESLYGVTELACWLIRIVVNVIEIILIQSLYTMWKDEELVNKRLRDLTMAAVPISRENLPPLNSQYYQNNGYDHSVEQINATLSRYGSTPHLWAGPLPNNMIPLPIDGYQFCTTQSEFNASIFVPNIINNDMAVKKAQSLMDLRFLEENTMVGEKLGDQVQPWMSESITETSSAIIPNYRVSPDTKTSPRLTKCASVDALNEINKGGHIIRNRTGFYAQPVANYGVPIYYGPLDGPDFLIYKKQVDRLTSKNSLSNASADDVQKYRDVAL